MRLIAIACVLVHVAQAHASPDDIVFAGADPALRAALDDAFAPAKIIGVADPAPTSIGALTAESRRVAEREASGATIWLISEAGITTLVAYDRTADRVLVRTLEFATPLSDADAAVAARGARAMLRALRVEEVTPARPPVRIVVAPPPIADPPVAEADLERLATSVAVGARVGAPAGQVQGELALAAVWRPTRLGLVVDVRLATASQLRSDTFAGTIADHSASLAARLPVRLGSRTRAALVAGAAAHAVGFRGAHMAGAIADWHIDPAVRVGATLTGSVDEHVDVGFALSLDGLLRRQRYEVDGDEVLVMSRLQMAAGFLLSIRLL